MEVKGIENPGLPGPTIPDLQAVRAIFRKQID